MKSCSHAILLSAFTLVSAPAAAFDLDQCAGGGVDPGVLEDAIPDAQPTFFIEPGLLSDAFACLLSEAESDGYEVHVLEPIPGGMPGAILRHSPERVRLLVPSGAEQFMELARCTDRPGEGHAMQCRARLQDGGEYPSVVETFDANVTSVAAAFEFDVPAYLNAADTRDFLLSDPATRTVTLLPEGRDIVWTLAESDWGQGIYAITEPQMFRQALGHLLSDMPDVSIDVRWMTDGQAQQHQVEVDMTGAEAVLREYSSFTIHVIGALLTEAAPDD